MLLSRCALPASRWRAPRSATSTNWEDAAASWREAIRTEPKNDVAWHNLGYYLTHIVQDYDAAEAHFLHAIDLFPNIRLFLAGLGEVYFRQDRIPYAVEAYYQAGTGPPDLDERYDLDLQHLIDEIKGTPREND